MIGRLTFKSLEGLNSNLVSKSFDSLGLSGSSRTERRTSETGGQGLSHGQVTPVE